MVVVLIVAILGAIGMMSLKGTRDNGGRIELKAAARLYADAVERYQTDHGRRTPTLNSPAWPKPETGPVHRLAMGGAPTVRPYLTSAPPEVMTRTGPDSATFADAGRGEGGTLVYRRTGDLQFVIEAWWDGELMCSAGDVPAEQRPC